MTAPVISAHGLSKRYRRGLARSSETLRDAITRVAKHPLSAFRRDQTETFWSLKDVSLSVNEGEVLGLIGRNGAGKTTLLKILSRITRPTEGFAEIHGRVGSLLEVGTGFHAELSGRENTFLSGAILGMKKSEIDRKFDEIVAFAELEKFIDTPVKHYSSGMYVRLAFAVAAHLEPEILLVDEVLAVGDINFQKKCMGKMGDVARQGRTIVLVTHQLNQIRRLCHRVVWIDAGQIRQVGPTDLVVSAYESAMFSGERSTGIARGSSTRAQFLSWRILSPKSDNPHVLRSLDPVTIQFTIEIAERVSHADLGVALFNPERQLMWASSQHDMAFEPGIYALNHTLPTLPLRPGPYQWLVTFWENKEMLDSWDCSPELVISTEGHQHFMDEWNGLLNLPSKFLSESELKSDSLTSNCI